MIARLHCDALVSVLIASITVTIKDMMRICFGVRVEVSATVEIRL